MASDMDQRPHTPAVKKLMPGISSFWITDKENLSTFQCIPNPRAKRQAWESLFSLLYAIELQSFLFRFLRNPSLPNPFHYFFLSRPGVHFLLFHQGVISPLDFKEFFIGKAGKFFSQMGEFIGMVFFDGFLIGSTDFFF